MKHAIIKNVPKNPNKLFKETISKSFNFWVDEKGIPMFGEEMTVNFLMMRLSK